MEMDLFFQSLPFLALAVLLPLSLTIIFLFIKHKPTDPNLPPGKMGWPIVGETLEFLYMSRKGKPEKFIFDRTSKFSPEVFKTSLLGDNMAVFCTPTGNKFLFMNENKLVTSWWPRSFEKLFMSTTTHDKVSREGVKMRGMLPGFLKPEAIQKYIPIMDTLARDHLDNIWAPQKEVKVFDHAKKYTFALACKLFLSVDDPKRISVFAQPFAALTAGLMSLPIDLPGTAFNHAIKGAQFIRKLLLEIVRQRKKDLAEKKESGVRDLLTHMLLATDEDGRHMNEVDIADKIIGLLIGGHDTASTALTFIMLYLADLPHIYNEVYKEQMEIAKSKRPDELLNWEDIQKMKYSWNVACEAIRLAPPAQGGFRQAIHDFTYNGFTIPKGWKTYWTVHTTNKNPKYFPDPEKFDPTRFEGAGPAPYTYVPFGGGPRMCPGKEYARMEILVFMYNLVRKFKWEKLDPNEKIIHDPTPIPVNGLPVRLIPHNI